MWATTSCARHPAAALGVCQSASHRSRQNVSSSERSRRNAPTGSVVTRIPYGNLLNCLGLMTRIEIADIRETDELLELVRRAPCDGLEQEADVVADVVAAQHLTDEPSGGVVEDWYPVRARVPGAARELVGPVPGLAAEETGEFAVLPWHKMHRKMLGPLGHPVGVVAFRQSHHEPRRANAYLTGEPDEAARRLVADAGGDDKHRIIEQGDQSLERFRHRSVARVVPWPESMRPPTPSACPTYWNSSSRDIAWCSPHFARTAHCRAPRCRVGSTTPVAS